ncbi:hypothetical protein OC842_001605 [Tilletia horrida]|uniref:Uncharacterized protein n=1 Tax=Tilletia horrida TaxID=155126 RepID=A0AAN6JME4_9BASI|nr:hypothetical protein OC842_001605 [Tilletia horrida]
MLLSLNTRRAAWLGLVAPVVLLFLLAVAVAHASPSAALGRVPPLGRARSGKYVGSLCTDSSQCYSENCVSELVFGGDPSVFRCRRQEAGGPCFENNNCGSRICQPDGRCGFSATNGRCDWYDDCIGWLNSTTQCVSHRCKLVQGAACAKNNQCISGVCRNKVCRVPAQAPNAACEIDSECLSGKCVTVPYNQCTTPDGAFTTCPGTLPKHCARYGLGHSCANNGECNEGLCKSGVCSASQDGDSCVSQYQCSGPSLCGSDNKCDTPATASLAPTQPCDDDDADQCVSGRCVSTLPGRDNYNINTGFDQPQDPPKCDFLNNGQAGCASFADCRTGVCAQGTCRAGLDGDACQVNYNCVHLCGLDGVCYSPSSGPQGAGKPCKQDAQCLSNKCSFAYNSVNRPRLGSTSDFPIGTSDTSCSPSSLDGACAVDSDCAQGTCDASSSTCKLQSIDSPCTTDSQCTTNSCFYADEYDASSGTCQLAPGGNDCSADSQCYSGTCTYYPGPPYCNGPCPGRSSCDAIELGGTCRRATDCGDGNVCNDEDKCAVRDITTIQCEADFNCPQGYCVSGFCSLDPPPPPPSSSGNRSKAPASASTSSSTKSPAAASSATKSTTSSSANSSSSSSSSATASSSSSSSLSKTPAASTRAPSSASTPASA